MDVHHRRRIRTMQIPEDADDAGEVIAWEVVTAPDWICEHCTTRNDGWRSHCAMCGRGREDGWE